MGTSTSRAWKGMNPCSFVYSSTHVRDTYWMPIRYLDVCQVAMCQACCRVLGKCQQQHRPGPSPHEESRASERQANKLVRKWRSCAANWDNVSKSGEMPFTAEALSALPLLDASPTGSPLEWFAVFLLNCFRRNFMCMGAPIGYTKYCLVLIEPFGC